MSEEAVGVQTDEPARDAEANAALPECMSSMASCDNTPILEEEDDVNTSRPSLGGSKGKWRETDDDSGHLKSKKKTRSWVWDHFTRKSNNYDKCRCNHCGKELACPTSWGTSNMSKHLSSCKQHKVLQSAFTEQNQPMFTPHSDGLRIGEVGEKEFREACNKMLVLGELPLSFIESLAWRNFCNKVQLPMPHSRRTATRDIVEMFVKKKAAIKKILEDNKQRLSLTTDIWVAPDTGASYMIITAHYIDASWQLRKHTIGFKNLCDHKGETICNVLIECLAEWSIKKVFCITVDNVICNSLAMRTFRERFMQLENDSLVLNGDHLYVRCAIHILNLVVNEGLQEVDNSIAAIRNGVQFVRSSTNRLKSFDMRAEIGKISQCSLPLDIKTRWDTTYLMLNTALKFRLVFTKMEEEDKLYNEYFLETVEGKKRLGPPTDDDWESVEALLKVLGLFYNATVVLSGSTSVCSHKCYSEIATIVTNLNCYSKCSNVPLQNKALAMLGKLDKYWKPFGDMNKLLIVASVFDPSKKMKFAQLCFEKLYGKDSIEASHLNSSVMDILNQLFEKYTGFLNQTGVAGESRTSAHAQSHMQSSQSQEQGDCKISDIESDFGYERMNSLFKKFVEETRFQESSNELELYLKENVENPNLMKGDSDVLSWWEGRGSKFPVLSLVARDILAMQVSSVASESVFSTSGRILNPSRSCLTHYMIEVLMCLKQWLECEIQSNDEGIMSMHQMLSDIQLHDDLMREFGEMERA